MTELDDLIDEQRKDHRQGKCQYPEDFVAVSLDSVHYDISYLNKHFVRDKRRPRDLRVRPSRQRGCREHGHEHWIAYDTPKLNGSTGRCRVCSNLKQSISYARRTKRTDPAAGS